jgi:transcriptional regulator with XRE-family HTH domain
VNLAREAREALNLTQQDMGDLLGVHRVTVAKWETGDDLPPVAKRLLWLALSHPRITKRALAKLTEEGP